MKLPVYDLLGQYEDELIDVLRIRLWNSNNATAVLSDFYSTERVLAQWAQASGCGAVRFEVSFVDGYVLKGAHAFYSMGKRQRTFSTHLHHVMKRMAEAEDFAQLPPTKDASRYMIPAY